MKTKKPVVAETVPAPQEPVPGPRPDAVPLGGIAREGLLTSTGKPLDR